MAGWGLGGGRREVEVVGHDVGRGKAEVEVVEEWVCGGVGVGVGVCV